MFAFLPAFLRRSTPVPAPVLPEPSYGALKTRPVGMFDEVETVEDVTDVAPTAPIEPTRWAPASSWDRTFVVMRAKSTTTLDMRNVPPAHVVEINHERPDMIFGFLLDGKGERDASKPDVFDALPHYPGTPTLKIPGRFRADRELGRFVTFEQAALALSLAKAAFAAAGNTAEGKAEREAAAVVVMCREAHEAAEMALAAASAAKLEEAVEDLAFAIEQHAAAQFDAAAVRDRLVMDAVQGVRP